MMGCRTYDKLSEIPSLITIYFWCLFSKRRNTGVPNTRPISYQPAGCFGQHTRNVLPEATNISVPPKRRKSKKIEKSR
jgi:hypothetical protein